MTEKILRNIGIGFGIAAGVVGGGCAQDAAVVDAAAEVIDFSQLNADSLDTKIDALEKQGIHVRDSHDAGSREVAYILPDIHLSSIGRKQRAIIEKLAKHGINQVALEGLRPDVCGKEWGMKNFEDNKGDYSIHDIDEYLHLGGEKPKKIQTLDDFKKSNAIWSLSLEPDFVVRGLESKKVTDLNSELNLLYLSASGYNAISKRVEQVRNQVKSIEFLWRFGAYKTEKEKADAKKCYKGLNEALKESGPALAKSLEEIRTLRAKVIGQARELGYGWFSLPEEVSDEFVERLDQLKNRIVLHERSYEAVKRIRQIGGSMAVVYGEGHLGEIKAGLREAGISYVVLGEKYEIKSAPGFEERLKEVLCDEEMRIHLSYRSGDPMFELILEFEKEQEMKEQEK
jgi:hypothetical protein